MAAVHALVLLAVLAALGFLVIPYVKLILVEMGHAAPPAASCLSVAAFFGPWSPWRRRSSRGSCWATTAPRAQVREAQVQGPQESRGVRHPARDGVRVRLPWSSGAISCQNQLLDSTACPSSATPSARPHARPPSAPYSPLKSARNPNRLRDEARRSGGNQRHSAPAKRRARVGAVSPCSLSSAPEVRPPSNGRRRPPCRRPGRPQLRCRSLLLPQPHGPLPNRCPRPRPNLFSTRDRQQSHLTLASSGPSVTSNGCKAFKAAARADASSLHDSMSNQVRLGTHARAGSGCRRIGYLEGSPRAMPGSLAPLLIHGSTPNSPTHPLERTKVMFVWASAFVKAAFG